MPRDLFDQLDIEWSHIVRSRQASQAIARWQLLEPILRDYPTLEELMSVMQDRAAAVRLPAVRAVIRMARTDPLAQRAALQLLVPGLAHAAREYRHRWGDDGAAMLTCFALERLSRWNDDRWACPASAIVLEARRHLYVTHRAERMQQGPTGSLASIELMTEHPVEDEPTASDELTEVLADAVESGHLDIADAQLIYRNRVLGIDMSILAADHRVATVWIRRRRHRAEQQLRTSLAVSA